jgi:8-oxo-dGTP pyrophosphatase MutT (NUDIX family)
MTLLSLLNLVPHQQVAALPYRMSDGGWPELLLITSRRSRRWVIPKGNLMPGRTWPQAAAQEAFEEAGVVGAIGSTPIGTYRYRKKMGLGWRRRCIVAVYPLAVEQELDDWPERDARDTRWVDWDEAVDLVDDPELTNLIQAFRLETAGGNKAEM